MQQTVLLAVVVVVCGLLPASVASDSADCEEGCPNTAPKCCAMMDGSSMCCPYGTRCDTTYGCMLAARSPREGSSDDNERVHRTALHESITSVYFTISFALRMVGYAVVCAVSLFALSCLHRTAIFKVQNWHRRRMEAIERQESSDEEADTTPQPSEDEGAEDDELAPLANHAAVKVASPGDGEGRCLKCSNAINCVLMQCNHAVVCHSCAKKLKQCPRCSETIHRRQKLFVVA